MSGLEEFSPKQNFPYLHGAKMGINAISDAYLVIDGPNCSFHKAEHFFGSHDFCSTLLDVNGWHRIINTDLHVDKIISGHDHLFLRPVTEVAASGKAGAVVVASLPMAHITGIAYDDLVDDIRSDYDVPFFVMPTKSLSGDWIDGYGDLLTCIAKTIELKEQPLDPGKVAIVGYFMDRNEGDHRGNVEELKTMVSALGLDTSCVWLEGNSFDELRKVEEAQWIISLPHGEKAARRLARRTGATLIKCPLPFGLRASEEFVRTLGGAVDRSDEAERYIESQMRSVAPALKWVIPKRFLDRNIAFIGDPFVISGFCDIASSLGMQIRSVAATAHERKLEELEKYTFAGLPISVIWEPSHAGSVPKNTELDLLVGCQVSRTAQLSNSSNEPIKTLEFGFPSRANHYLAPSPYLGFKGMLNFVDRMSNVVGDLATGIM
jgi:nitrogenase molybdenum-iron protein alpha/beta subunit